MKFEEVAAAKNPVTRQEEETMEKNKKILVVDDDKGIGQMLSMVLERNGYEVLVSEIPEEAEKNIIVHNIDVVLLDMLIGAINGLDVCSRLRKDETTKHVTIIMMSALPDVEKRCKAAGANDFFSKPFDLDDLLSKINNSYKDLN